VTAPAYVYPRILSVPASYGARTSASAVAEMIVKIDLPCDDAAARLRHATMVAAETVPLLRSGRSWRPSSPRFCIVTGPPLSDRIRASLPRASAALQSDFPSTARLRSRFTRPVPTRRGHTQVGFVEAEGGRLILMASRALCQAAKAPDDYVRVYDRILRQVQQPVILHWLGECSIRNSRLLGFARLRHRHEDGCCGDQ
jgi:Protein of unknown function (DUF993)